MLHAQCQDDSGSRLPMLTLAMQISSALLQLISINAAYEKQIRGPLISAEVSLGLRGYLKWMSLPLLIRLVSCFLSLV